MKRPVMLMLLLALWLGFAWAQLEPLPSEARFDTPTTFVTEAGGESLRAMVDALARSVGLTPIVDSVPESQVSFNIDQPKPFRQIWTVVLTQYGLDYALLDNDVVVVGPPDSVAGFKAGTATVAQSQQEGAAQSGVTQFYRVNNNPEDVATIVRQAVPGVQVTVLGSVRSISVQGTQEQQDRVRALLEQFDQASDTTPNVLRIYQLSNANATALAEVLGNADLLVGSESVAADGGTLVSEGRSFTVVADERTNTLIVTAPPSIQAQIAELIPQLDVPQQQVNVQVRIQEISSTAASRLGINLTAGLGNFAATLLSNGLSFVFDAQSAVSGLNLGSVLNTLESQGLSRRVDDSNMTVLNNGTGNMKSGGRIEITFEGADGEISQRTIEFGVIIEVKPRISSDGRIILDVSAEVSDLLTPFSEGGIPQRIDFSERKVTSTVTLQPGQTVLLGGLMQNQFSSTQSGVPVLSSLPVVGGLFRTTTVENDDTDLLLIVTANVVE